MTREELPSGVRDAGGSHPSDRIDEVDGALRSRLDEAGYLVLEALMSAELLQALRRRIAELYDLEADNAGNRLCAEIAREVFEHFASPKKDEKDAKKE